jgi:hypothetical protein
MAPATAAGVAIFAAVFGTQPGDGNVSASATRNAHVRTEVFMMADLITNRRKSVRFSRRVCGKCGSHQAHQNESFRLSFGAPVPSGPRAKIWNAVHFGHPSGFSSYMTGQQPSISGHVFADRLPREMQKLASFRVVWISNLRGEALPPNPLNHRFPSCGRWT